MKIDLTRFEEISGREALRRLADGLSVFEKDGAEFSFDFETNETVWVRKDGKKFVGNGNAYPITLEAVAGAPWYIKKPFDVRQAMRDKPDEWVAAFKTSENDWVKVGFDTSEFTVVGLELSNDAPVNATHDYFKVCVYGTDLDACIPLDEVPADAR